MVDKRFYKHLGPFSLIELLDGIDVDIPEGQFCDLLVKNAAPIAAAGTGEITYLDGKGVVKKALDCKAEVCLVRVENAVHLSDTNAIILISEYPQADFAVILERLYKRLGYGTETNDVFPGVDIGRGVVIGAGTQIGAGTRIDPNSVIGPGVVIGDNCEIGANVVIKFSIIGNNCKIHHGTVLGGPGFGVAKNAKGGVDIPHVGSVLIGNDVTIGCLTTIDRAMFGNTSIGDGTKLDNSIQIAHNVKIGRHCTFAAHSGISGSVTIGDGVIMGGKVGIPDHITVGDGATLAAMANPMRNVPAGEVWSGTPAVPIREHMRQISYLRRMAKAKPKRKS